MDGERRPLLTGCSLQVFRTARVEGIAQAVADQVDAQDRKDDEQAGKDPHPPRAALDEGLRAGEHIAPRCRRRLYAETQEGYVGFGKDRARQSKRRGDDDRAHGVRHEVAEEHAPVACAERFGGGDVVHLAQRQDVGADDAGKIHPRGQADDEDHDAHASAETASKEGDVLNVRPEIFSQNDEQK